MPTSPPDKSPATDPPAAQERPSQPVDAWTPAAGPVVDPWAAVFPEEPSWWRRNLGKIVSIAAVFVVMAGTVVAAVTLSRADRVVVSPEVAAAVSAEAATPSVTPSPSASASSTAPAVTTASGTVRAVDGSSWQVEVERGLTLTVQVTPATKFDKGRTAADIKAGTKVAIKGTLAAGVITAATVSVQRADKSN